MNYTKGAFPLLRFHFVGVSGGGIGGVLEPNSVMIVNTPGGSHVCNDDSFGAKHPTIDFQNPGSGRYDVWLGTFGAGGTIGGTLHVTERADRHPEPVVIGPGG